MRAEVVTPDRAVARQADRQHGAVTREQLREAGLSDSAIGRRVAAGQLHPVHRGVYAVGHRRLPVEGRWMAAVLACGESAALSHRSAAALWGLAPRSGPAVGSGGRIDVVVPYGAGGLRHTGIRIHRSRSLPPGSIVRRDGIPVTSPARTLADMRRSATASELRSMVRKAEVLGLATGLAPRAEPTRSDLEDLFLDFCERYGFPAPAVNRMGRGDRGRLHLARPQGRRRNGQLPIPPRRPGYENDHERDLDLRAAGYDVVRLTWRQLTKKPDRCAKAVDDALRSALRPGRGRVLPRQTLNIEP